MMFTCDKVVRLSNIPTVDDKFIKDNTVHEIVESGGRMIANDRVFMSKTDPESGRMIANDRVFMSKTIPESVVDKAVDSRPSCVVLMTIRNCAKFLGKIFANVEGLGKLFGDFGVVITFDNCEDKSESMILDYQKQSSYRVLVKNTNFRDNRRTVRIANGRNACLEIMEREFPATDFHIVLDADNVNSDGWKLSLLERYLADNRWDCLTFNRKYFYDIFALAYDKYVLDFAAFGSNFSHALCTNFFHDINRRLRTLPKDQDLFVCHSSFNGFGIYRTSKFKGIRYTGDRSEVLGCFSKTQQKLAVAEMNRNFGLSLSYDISDTSKNGEACEHVAYHRRATEKYGAKIMICKYILHN